MHWKRGDYDLECNIVDLLEVDPTPASTPHLHPSSVGEKRKAQQQNEKKKKEAGDKAGDQGAVGSIMKWSQ